MQRTPALTELEHAIEQAALYRAATVRLSIDAARTIRTVVLEAVEQTIDEELTR